METVPPSVASAASQSRGVARQFHGLSSTSATTGCTGLWEDDMFLIRKAGFAPESARARAFEGSRGTPTATMESSTTADEDVELVGATGVDVRATPSLPN